MRKQIQSRIARAVVLCGSIAATCSTYAQTAALELEEVVVTGSRVATNGNDSPTPVTVVNVQDMETVRPGTIADQLNDMPQFFGSQGQTSVIGNGANTNGNPNGAGNVLNLRNFGANRNLILFDGHRVAPTSANSTVSIDNIPQLLLQRVDVVTGGASAVYGADAVTGVVNFITDTKFKGLKVNAQAGRSQQHDDDIVALGVAGGIDLFGGRGHFLGSYEYRDDEGIDKASSRQWGRDRWFGVQVAAPAGTQARTIVPNSTRQDASFGGTISTLGTAANPFNNYYFASNGVLAPVNPGIPIPGKLNARDGASGSGSYFDQSVKAALTTHQVFARLDYDFSGSVHGWVKGVGTDVYNGGYAISNPTAQASNNSNIHAVFVGNPFLPQVYRDQMTAAGVTQFGFNKVHSGPGMDQYRQFTEAFGRNYSIDTGLSGSFGEGWKWELALVYGNNELRVLQNNGINKKKLAAALDAVTPAGGGAPVCWVSTQAQFTGLYPGCVAYNAFGPSITAAEADWIFDPLESTTPHRHERCGSFRLGFAFQQLGGTRDHGAVRTGTPAELQSGHVQCAGRSQ